MVTFDLKQRGHHQNVATLYLVQRKRQLLTIAKILFFLPDASFGKQAFETCSFKDIQAFCCPVGAFSQEQKYI